MRTANFSFARGRAALARDENLHVQRSITWPGPKICKGEYVTSPENLFCAGVCTFRSVVTVTTQRDEQSANVCHKRSKCKNETRQQRPATTTKHTPAACQAPIALLTLTRPTHTAASAAPVCDSCVSGCTAFDAWPRPTPCARPWSTVRAPRSVLRTLPCLACLPPSQRALLRACTAAAAAFCPSCLSPDVDSACSPTVLMGLSRCLGTSLDGHRLGTVGAPPLNP